MYCLKLTVALGKHNALVLKIHCALIPGASKDVGIPLPQSATFWRVNNKYYVQIPGIRPMDVATANRIWRAYNLPEIDVKAAEAMLVELVEDHDNN